VENDRHPFSGTLGCQYSGQHLAALLDAREDRLGNASALVNATIAEIRSVRERLRCKDWRLGTLRPAPFSLLNPRFC
jgi:hypothetical protein